MMSVLIKNQILIFSSDVTLLLGESHLSRDK